MPILSVKTTIFIEFENILFDTDTFILGELYLKYINASDELRMLFKPLMDIIDKYGVDNLYLLSQIKHNRNPLYDFIDHDMEYPNKKEICDFLYDSILYGEYDIEYMHNLELTNIGKSIYQLLIDENLDKLYIYINRETDSIMNFLVTWLNQDTRIEYITGNKNDFLEKIECESYFLSRYDDIESIAKLSNPNKIMQKDVVIPEYKFNIDKEGNLRYKNMTYSKLFDDFNINVTSAKLPIV